MARKENLSDLTQHANVKWVDSFSKESLKSSGRVTSLQEIPDEGRYDIFVPSLGDSGATYNNVNGERARWLIKGVYGLDTVYLKSISDDRESEVRE